MSNTATVSYGDKTYTVTVDVRQVAGEDGMPTMPPPPIPATGSTDADTKSVPVDDADAEYEEDFELEGDSSKIGSSKIGGRKPRRTNRRGPGRPRKTRRYRRRSIRK